MKLKKILLVNPPFCTPASPPYSITNIQAFLKNNLTSEYKSEVLDLNIIFHNKQFPEYHKYYKSLKFLQTEYTETTKKYKIITKKTYAENNKKVVQSRTPELFEECLKEITSKNPAIVAFSIVYSSQAFFTYALIKELKKLEIKTVVGGPSVNEKLQNIADATLKNETELLEYITKQKPAKINHNTVLDFKQYNNELYFSPEIVIPIKTTTNCYYKQCTFCTHYNNTKYEELPLENIKKTIINSKNKNFFIIDDMIHKKRLLQLAEMLKPLNVSWTCQIKPTKDLDYETLKILQESGLKMVMWGVESASNRVLKLMNKSTKKEDIQKVLKDSHKADIKNITYIMFGFPTETKEEFIETVQFLKDNKQNIDLVSPAIFGLQKGSAVYEHPSDFGITKIEKEERTILSPKLSYETNHGLTQDETRSLLKQYKHTIESANKYPKIMNFFREHMLLICQ